VPLLDGKPMIATAMNGAGQLIGSNGEFIHMTGHPVYWDGTTIRDLGSFGGSGIALGLNNLGHIVGIARTANEQYRAFFWDGTLHEIGSFGSPLSTGWTALAINDADDVVGSSFFTEPFVLTAFLRRGGETIDLGALTGGAIAGVFINSVGQVVGARDADSYFLWDGSTTIDFGPLQPVAMNDAGQLAGTFDPGTGQRAASAGRISNGHASALRAKLDAAARQVEHGNAAAAKNILQAFIIQVQNLVSRGVVSAADGQALIDTAQTAIDNL
jgi:probable HAF family extracellular repeat protein